MKCENCKGTGFQRYYIKEYLKAGYTKEMKKTPKGYNILKCRICKGTGESNEKPKYYEVVDQNGPRHDSHGVMARLMTFEEVKVLMSVLDKKWDGCEGSYSLHINLVYERDIGLKKWLKYLCKHEWSKTAVTFLRKKTITLKKGLYYCPKCNTRWRVSNRPDNKLPAYFGIGYWDEGKQCVVVPKVKEFIDVPEEEK